MYRFILLLPLAIINSDLYFINLILAFIIYLMFVVALTSFSDVDFSAFCKATPITITV